MNLSDDTALPAPADAAHPPATAATPGPWSGLGTVALYFLLQFGLGILAGIAVGFALGVVRGFKAGVTHHAFDPHALAQTMRTNPDVRVAVTVLTILAAALVMTAFVRRTWPAQWSRAELPGFGLVRPASRLAYPGAVLLAVLVLMVGNLMTHLLSGAQPVHQDVTVMAGHVNTGARVLLAVLVVCVAPFVEELVFRGVLLSGLARRMPSVPAVIVSALVFGGVHLPDFGFAWYPVPALVLLGLVLAWLRLRTRSLWPSVTLHATNNFLAVLAWFIATHH